MHLISCLFNMILLGYAYILIQIEIFYNFQNMNSIGVYFLVAVLAHQTTMEFPHCLVVVDTGSFED